MQVKILSYVYASRKEPRNAASNHLLGIFIMELSIPMLADVCTESTTADVGFNSTIRPGFSFLPWGSWSQVSRKYLTLGASYPMNYCIGTLQSSHLEM